MPQDFSFNIAQQSFDENYEPASETRLTTNFANLARSEKRRENLSRTINMINHRFNELAYWDNPHGKRYSVNLDIVSVDINVTDHDLADGEVASTPSTKPSTALEALDVKFPSIEFLKTSINDHETGKVIEGIAGNNFSSYVRDYDFSVLLSNHNKGKKGFSVPSDFGELHGKLFKRFLQSEAYQAHFYKAPVICLSVSDSKTYHQTDNHHPELGIEYQPSETSLTEQYFNKMGLSVRYFMPSGTVAPLAFFHIGDLLNDYTHLELISTIATMETFQKIYRPEIYNTFSKAGKQYKANLREAKHAETGIVYDREERTSLAIKQGKFAEEHFIKPYQSFLTKWSQQTNL